MPSVLKGRPRLQVLSRTVTPRIATHYRQTVALTKQEIQTVTLTKQEIQTNVRVTMVTLTKQETQMVTLTKQDAMLKLKATIKTKSMGLYTSRGISHPT